MSMVDRCPTAPPAVEDVLASGGRRLLHVGGRQLSGHHLHRAGGIARETGHDHRGNCGNSLQVWLGGGARVCMEIERTGIFPGVSVAAAFL